MQIEGLKCGSLEGYTGDPGTVEGPLAAWSFLPSLACQPGACALPDHSLVV